MARQRGRAATVGDYFSHLWSLPKAPVQPPVENATIGWRPSTLRRMSSGISQHHAHATLSTPASEINPAPLLMRQLSCASKKRDGALIKVEVMEVASPGTVSDSSTNSQRILWDSSMLKPAHTSSSGKKLRQRAPSPYPEVKEVRPLSKINVQSQPVIRTRTLSLESEQEREMYSPEKYSDISDILPRPGSTPYRAQTHRPSSASSLSSPEGSDAASEASDTDSECSGLSGWGCNTSYNYRVPTPPVFTLCPDAPLCQSPLQDSQSDTACGTAEDGEDLPKRYLRPASAWDPDSWLPADPSMLDGLPGLRGIPRLSWGIGIAPDGQRYTTSSHPPTGVTAGVPNGAGGPTHTPMPGYYHSKDPRLMPVSMEQLVPRLEALCQELRVEHFEGLCNVSGYDEDMERISTRRPNGVGGLYPNMQALRPELIPRSAYGHMPTKSLLGADISPLDLSSDIILPDYAAANPTDKYTRRTRSSPLPKSKAHRQRAASRANDAPHSNGNVGQIRCRL